ncbi:TetR/AcrR family transcriptional regulator [Actinomadura macrotermitis]|uniref:Putative HTH-type transcriptional regulator n=1 Tax=Actinomadura macrotermitis TaxID=2585200 RepID=A0A7K0C6F6_9ACTN|nr:TetR/AcrR family transcriptional regulator [Actinomadura macrotermitis]MQY08926.1 putative HTH-type transcriptional regulator [Actinomadura macrotermitis]
MSPRRPERRSEESANAVIRAAMELCQEVGYRKLSIEGIAARAGVGKNTIYRWWPSKAAVLLDGLLSTWRVDASFPDTGDFAADIKAQMTAAARLLGDPDVLPHYRALIGEAQHDPELHQALWDRFIGHLAGAAVERIKAAQRAGQIRADADPVLVTELLYGAAYYRMLLTPRAVDAGHVSAVIDLALAGLAPSQG